MPGTGKKQPANDKPRQKFIQPVADKKSSFIFMADKWNPKDLKDSHYLWLPVQFKNGIPFIEWKDEWSLDFFDLQPVKQLAHESGEKSSENKKS